jgi:hypothetical protein
VEFCDASLQLLVDILSTADETDTTHTEAMSIDSFLGSFTDSGVVGQSQIVVSAEIEDTLPTLNLNLSTLRASDDSFDLVCSGLLYALKGLLARLVQLYTRGCSYFSYAYCVRKVSC